METIFLAHAVQTHRISFTEDNLTHLYYFYGELLQSPPYIKDLLSPKPATNYALRSSTQSLLFVPKANCSSLGDRAFAHAAPILWNSLPLTIRTSSSLAIFKKQLKTFLFRKAFSSFQ